MFISCKAQHHGSFVANGKRSNSAMIHINKDSISFIDPNYSGGKLFRSTAYEKDGSKLAFKFENYGDATLEILEDEILLKFRGDISTFEKVTTTRKLTGNVEDDLFTSVWLFQLPYSSDSINFFNTKYPDKYLSSPFQNNRSELIKVGEAYYLITGFDGDKIYPILFENDILKLQTFDDSKMNIELKKVKTFTEDR